MSNKHTEDWNIPDVTLLEDYCTVYTLDELEVFLERTDVVAFDIKTAPDEPYRHEENAALDPRLTGVTRMASISTL